MCFITGDAGRRVVWYNNNIVKLYSPTLEQCEDVVSRMIKEQQVGEGWWINLSKSSSECALVIISNLNECKVRTLDIWDTPLDSECVSTLSEMLKTNKITKRLELEASLLTGDIKQMIDALSINNTLERLVLWNVPITDEDTTMTHLSRMLTVNKALKELALSHCNITDNGVQYICEGLTKNQTLTWLNISDNHQISSVSTSTIMGLINMTTSLTQLDLNDTSLIDDDIKTICTALAKSSTLQTLTISKQHEEGCINFNSYQFIKDKLKFL